MVPAFYHCACAQVGGSLVTTSCASVILRRRCSSVAEQLIRNQQVAGSSPAAGSSNKPAAPITYELRGRDYLAHGRLMCDRLSDFRNGLRAALGPRHLTAEMVWGQVGVAQGHLDVLMAQDRLQSLEAPAAHP